MGLKDDYAQKPTVRDFILGIQPKTWGENEVNFDKWFEWPPDLFLLTSSILKNTGAYRYIANQPVKGDIWPTKTWLGKTKNMRNVFYYAKEWLIGLCKDINVDPLEQFKQTLKNSQDIPIEVLHRIRDIPNEPQKKGWEFIKVVYQLHAIADEAFKSLGILYGRRENITKGSEEIDPSKVFLLANYLLVVGGTLSRISRHQGVVIPKMRTPKVGFTLRSMSHYLTYHNTEVDVGWYTGPWINSNEDSLNIMVVPWPYKIDANYFETEQPNLLVQGRDRYFTYKQPEKNNESTGSDIFEEECKNIISRIINVRNEVSKVHLLVLPEVALRPKDLYKLRESLETEIQDSKFLSNDSIPIIITGLSDESDGEDSPNAYKNRNSNKVILSVYSGYKWFSIIQHKHHRWRLDNSQIRDYELSAQLTGDYTYWESINIMRRRISFFAPNAWLTICPLICEDLARLEPVSEVIRGVGPTLLTALLLDGPQIKSRWPGRYASILADDPGTSVLTLTALGMVKRSNNARAKEKGEDSQKMGEEIGLWKDELSGWKSIQVEKIGENLYDSKILTIKSNWLKEYTMDGRMDSEVSATLSLENIFSSNPKPEFTKTIDENFPIEIKEDIVQNARNESNIEGRIGQNVNADEHTEFEKIIQGKEFSKANIDLLELSIFTHFIDTAIDLPIKKINELFDITMITFDSNNETNPQSKPTKDQVLEEVMNSVKFHFKTRKSIPKSFPSFELLFGIEYATKFLRELADKSNPEKTFDSFVDKERDAYLTNLIDMYDDNDDVLNEVLSKKRNKIVKEIEGLIKSNEELLKKGRFNTKGGRMFFLMEYFRIRLSVPEAILMGLHRRFSNKRRKGNFSRKDHIFLKDIEEKICTNKVKIYKNWEYKIKDSYEEFEYLFDSLKVK